MGWWLYIDDEVSSLDLASALPEVSVERREKALRYRNDELRRQSVAAWLLLKKALGERYGITSVPSIATAEHGKPFFPSMPKVHFNMSHCLGVAACVIGDRPVGVDVETIHAVSTSLVKRVLSAAEHEAVERSHNPQMEFMRLWTVKESLLKLSGHGLVGIDELAKVITPEANYSTVVNTSRGYVSTVAWE